MRAARVGLKASTAGGAAEADVWAVHVSVKARGLRVAERGVLGCGARRAEGSRPRRGPCGH